MGKLRATIEISIGYESVSITLTARNWARVKSGKALEIRGKGYYYEGQFFWDYWSFGGGLEGSLNVYYGNGGGQGYSGTLSGARLSEHE